MKKRVKLSKQQIRQSELEIGKTHRFMKDLESYSRIVKQKAQYIKDLMRVVKINPIPPETDDWKTLKQFPIQGGRVCALKIDHYDRLVYELIDDGTIIFTNCIGHSYRGKSYSELETLINW